MTTEEEKDEAERGNAEWARIMPPLYAASWERLELCRDALALALLDGGVPLRMAKELANRCTARLQEPLDQ